MAFAGEFPRVSPHCGAGAGLVARIERFMLDGTRCGMNQGRHAAWNWAYRVFVPGCSDSMWGDRGLNEARSIAACYAEIVREDWAGGRTFRRGARGGLKAVSP